MNFNIKAPKQPQAVRKVEPKDPAAALDATALILFALAFALYAWQTWGAK